MEKYEQIKSMPQEYIDLSLNAGRCKVLKIVITSEFSQGLLESEAGKLFTCHSLCV